MNKFLCRTMPVCCKQCASLRPFNVSKKEMMMRSICVKNKKSGAERRTKLAKRQIKQDKLN